MTNVAIIGCGGIAPAHFRAVQENGYNLTAVCDLDRELAEARCREFGYDNATVYTDYCEMLEKEDTDVVCVATPPAMHCEMAIAAMKAGNQVMCEKPSTLDSAENRAIIAAAKETGKHTMFLSSRFRNGGALQARDYVERGDLGQIYRADIEWWIPYGRPGADKKQHPAWFGDKTIAGGGVFMDMGQYFLDTVMWLIDWPRIKTVSATTFKGFPTFLPDEVVYDVEDHCTFLSRLDKDITLTLDITARVNQHWRSRITILGTKGGIVLDDTKGKGHFSFITNEGRPGEIIEHLMHSPRSSGGMTTMLHRLAAGEQIGTTPEQALALTELAEATYESAANGHEVSLGE